MDESLVLMRRKYCWDMDDIIYAALKVQDPNKKRKPLQVRPEVQAAIDEHIWADKYVSPARLLYGRRLFLLRT